MEQYLDRIECLMKDLEADIASVKATRVELAKKTKFVEEDKKKAEAMLADASAKLRIGEKYESIEALKVKCQEENVKNKEASAKLELFKDELEALEAKLKAEAKEVLEARNAVTGKIIKLKEREQIVLAREKKLKSAFIAKLEEELKG